MKSNGRRLTAEEVDVIRAKWTEGATPEEIAHAVGVHPSTVRRTVQRLGLPAHQEFGPLRVRRQWDEADLRLLKQLWDQGTSVEAIANRFGVSPDTVRRYAKLTGLGLRTQSGPSGMGEEGDALLRELWKAGVPVKEICAQLGGIHPVTLSYHTKRLGLPPRIKRRPRT